MQPRLLKLLLIIGVLAAWNTFEASCTLFVVALFTLGYLLSLSFAQGQLLYRQGFARQVFLENTFWYRWLHRKWIVIILSMLKALILTLLLLLSMRHWSQPVVMVMLMDIVVIIGLFAVHERWYATHAHQGARQLIAKKTVLWINTPVVVAVLIFVQLYLPPPPFVGATLLETLALAQSPLGSEACPALTQFLYWDRAREALGWWVMLQASSYFADNTLYLTLAWLLFLLIQSLYVWAFAQIILSAATDATVQKESSSFAPLALFIVLALGVLYALQSLSLRITMEETIRGIKAHIAKEQSSQLQTLNIRIDQAVDRLFEPSYDAVSTYADHQYVWYKDYVTLYQKSKNIPCKLTGFFCNEQSLEQSQEAELQSILFDQNGFDERYNAMLQTLNVTTRHELKHSEKRLLDQLPKGEHLQPIALQISQTFAQTYDTLQQFQMTKTTAQAGLTLLLTRTIMTKTLARSGVKTALKTEGTFGSVAACSASGPWMPLCALVVGSVVWVGSDVAVSAADRALTQDGLERMIGAELDEQKEMLKKKLTEVYMQGIGDLYGRLDAIALQYAPIVLIQKTHAKEPQ
ncbi:MAG: hypothetical protein JXK05_01780 [Campylobacterales bacterium]|nr:hypothetical protein [Campylobacterales bacterium]